MIVFRRFRRVAAFTLIELLTTMVVLAVLVSLSFGMVTGARQRSATGRAKAELALLAQALENYRRHFGDYPQTGTSVLNSQKVTALVGSDAAQALLFNSLTGVYGPRGVLAGRQNGPLLVDPWNLSTEVVLSPENFGVPVGSPPVKVPVANAFLDPWGNRYLYFYQRALEPGSASAWRAPGYVLYSAGPDGASSVLPPATGIFPGDNERAGDNADNLYAGKLL